MGATHSTRANRVLGRTEDRDGRNLRTDERTEKRGTRKGSGADRTGTGQVPDRGDPVRTARTVSPRRILPGDRRGSRSSTHDPDARTSKRNPDLRRSPRAGNPGDGVNRGPGSRRQGVGSRRNGGNPTSGHWADATRLSAGDGRILPSCGGSEPNPTTPCRPRGTFPRTPVCDRLTGRLGPKTPSTRLRIANDAPSIRTGPRGVKPRPLARQPAIPFTAEAAAIRRDWAGRGVWRSGAREKSLRPSRAP